MLSKIIDTLRDIFLWNEQPSQEHLELRVAVEKLRLEALREVKKLTRDADQARENEDTDLVRYSQGAKMAYESYAGKLKDILDNDRATVSKR